MKQLNVTNKEFSHLEHSFREWLEVLGYASTTVYGLPNCIHEFLYWLEHKNICRAKDITSDLTDRYFDYLINRSNTRRNGGLSNGHIAKHLQAIKRFSTYLRQTSQGGFTIERMTPKQERLIKDVLSLDEIKQLYDACENTVYGLRDKMMLSIFYGCGLRRNEGVQLDVQDVLLERQMIYVREGKNNTERYVPIQGNILKHIAHFVQHERTLLISQKNPHEQALFISQRGERVDGQSLMQRLKKIIERTQNEHIAQKNIGLHSLRHSIATHLLMGGMKLERIALFLGHKSTESTQIYTHVAAEMEQHQ